MPTAHSDQEISPNQEIPLDQGASEISKPLHQFSIELHTTTALDSDTSYRLENLPGELQRKHVLDRTRGELSLLGDLTHVIHGHLHPGGPAVTLMVFQFRFSGSQIQGRRFRRVTIETSFGHGRTEPIGSLVDPEVLAISPEGDFWWDHSSVTGEDKKGFTLSSGGLGGPILSAVGFAPELSVNWEVTTPTTKEGMVTMFGSRRVVGRNAGSKNTGRWVIRENKVRESGVPSSISTALLVKPHPRSGGVFRAVVGLDVEVDVMYNLDHAVKRMVGRSVVDPIVFKSDLEPMGPPIEGVEPQHLAKVIESGVLKKLGRVKPSTEGYD